MPESRAPQPVEVVFVRSGSGARATIQEWRSRATGRIHEVPEARVFAPAELLEEGASGWLIYAGGAPWVGDTQDEARRLAERAAERPPPVRGTPRIPRSRRVQVPWALVFAIVLIAVIVWAIAT